MIKTRKLLKAKFNKKKASVKGQMKKAARYKISRKQMSKKKTPVVSMKAPMEQVQSLAVFLRTTREKQIVVMNKQLDKIELKLNKLLTQKNKAEEKLTTFEQKVEEAPTGKDKHKIKSLRNNAVKVAREVDMLQNDLTTLQKALDGIHKEIKYLTALEEVLKRFYKEWQSSDETNVKKKIAQKEPPKTPVSMIEIPNTEEYPAIIVY